MTFFDVSAAPDLHPVAAVLHELYESAARHGIEVMVVGAVARDLLIRHIAGAPPQRATADVDIAVAVSTWDELCLLTNAIGPVSVSPHRFEVRGIRVDIIPFGPIESAQRTITWPNDHMMHVFGFREALAAAVRVKLPGGLVVTVASLPAQSLLKLFAWRDRRYHDRRDAIDLKSILRAYHQGGHLDELYTEHLDTLEKYEFDPALAGAERIGREANFLVAAADRGLLHAALEDELLRALASDMDGRPSDNFALLNAYRAGFA